MSDNDKILQNQNVKLDVEGLSEEQQREIERALKETSERVSDVGEKFSDMAKDKVEAVTEISRGLSELAYLGEKLDTPISQLKALDYAFEQIGAKPGAALANLENFYLKVREAPQILDKFTSELGKWGYEDKGTIKDKYESALKALAKEESSGGRNGEQIARAFARRFGLDEDLIDKLSHAQAEYDKYHAESVARTKGVDEMGPGAIALTQSLNHLWAALNDVATKLFGEHFEAISGILDTWTKWIRDNSGSLVHDFEEIGRQFVKAGEDLDAVFGPLLRNAKEGFILVGDAVARVLGIDEKSGIRGIRYLLDTMAALFGASVLIRLLSFLNSLALGAPSALVTGIFEGLGWGGAIALGATFTGLSALYETVRPQSAGEGEDELYRQAHPGWTPDKPKDPSWKPPAPTPLKVVHGQTEGVDPRLKEVMAAAATHLPQGYTAEVFSGVRGNNPSSQHFSGHALDIQIRKPSGELIPSSGPDTTGLYRMLGRAGLAEAQSRYPDLAPKFAWGGSFETSKGSGVPDLMHYDIGGERGGTFHGAMFNPQIHEIGPLQKPFAPAPIIANPLRNVDPEGFHNAIKNLQHESLNLPAYQPARVIASGNHVYKNNVTVYADNAHEAAIAVGARMDEIHAKSIDRIGAYEGGKEATPMRQANQKNVKLARAIG